MGKKAQQGKWGKWGSAAPLSLTPPPIVGPLSTSNNSTSSNSTSQKQQRRMVMASPNIPAIFPSTLKGISSPLQTQKTLQGRLSHQKFSMTISAPASWKAGTLLPVLKHVAASNDRDIPAIFQSSQWITSSTTQSSLMRPQGTLIHHTT